jgi:hypothetical protein
VADPNAREAVQRLLDAARRQQEAENAPRPCLDCGLAQTPGTAHYCTPKVSPADEAIRTAPGEQIAAALRAAGYEVVKAGANR